MYGSKGSNACPEGSTRIVNWTACAMAADDTGKRWQGTLSTNSSPRGCFVDDIYYVYFNSASPGAGRDNTQPLCIPGAPPRFCTATLLIDHT